MLWEKVSKVLSSQVFLVFLLVFLFLGTRLPGLGTDSINPDAVNWHFRSEQFVVGLKNGLWEKTYQHYHPGVTLMWIMGPAIEIARQVNPAYRVYDHTNFLYLHTVAKYSLVAVQLIFTLGVLYVLSKILDFKRAILVVLLFSLEPFFLGNSRMLHMDVLLSLFLTLGLGLSYLGFTEDKNQKVYLISSGIFFALSFLTKSVAIGGILFALGINVFLNFKNAKKLLENTLYLFLPFILSLFLFFPAMWVRPFNTIYRIFDEAERVGIRKGHGQIFFGSYTKDPGLLFYPIVLFLKSSPVLVLGLGLFIWGLMKKTIDFDKKSLNFAGYMTIFFLGYMLVMTISSKKIDRYLVPLFPYLSLLAIMGFSKFLWLKQEILIFLSGVLLLMLAFLFHPYQFTYATPLVGSTKTAHRIVAQKPFGVGIPTLKKMILQKYGNYPDLGFYDIKPMKTIYMSSQIADVEVNGVSDYDLLILGPDESMPKKALESDVPFYLDTVMKINGLEYWRIYVKDGFFEEK